MKFFLVFFLTLFLISCSTDNSEDAPENKPWSTVKAVEEFCKCADLKENRKECAETWAQSIEKYSDNIDPKKMGQGMSECDMQFTLEVLTNIMDESNH